MRWLIVASVWFAAIRLWGHGDLHEQIERVSAELSRKPKDPGLYIQRAALYRQHREWDKALQDIRRAQQLRKNPEDSYLRGVVLLESGKVMKARAALDAFLQASPNDPAGLIARARTHAALKEYAAATRDYSAALPLLKAPDPDLFIEQARCFAELKRFPDAVASLDQGIGRLGIVPSLQSYAIELEIARCKFDSALSRLDAMEGPNGMRLDLALLRGEILLKAGKRAEAREVFAAGLRKLETDPRRASARMRDIGAAIHAHSEKLSDESQMKNQDE